MELLRINDRKLKVMLTKEDLADLSLTCDTIDYDNTETRRAFWSILDEAKHKTGFDAAKDKVYVQVYPSRSGGCEIYVTRLSEGTASAPVSFCKSLFPERTLFRFEKLEDMLSACACLAECGFASCSSAYCETHAYYLFVGRDDPQPGKDGQLPSSRLSRENGLNKLDNMQIEGMRPSRRPSVSAADLVLEFGSKVTLDAEGWLCEHGVCICPDHAVERYASLAASHRRG